MKEGTCPVKPPLALLRYLLLLAAAVATPYTIDISSYPVYIAQILLLVLVVRVREAIAPEPWRLPLTLAESAWAVWIATQYGGAMYAVFWSTLLSLFEKRSNHNRMPATMLLFAAMNVSMLPHGSDWLLPANLGFCMGAVVLLRSARMEVGREDLQELYDELRRKHYELDEARKRMFEYAQKVEDSAQAEERNRIAREIHDDLGHKLIRLKMMLEAVLHIMPAQPDKGLELIRQVRDQLTDSMETMRKTVRRLKPDDADIQSWSLDRLMEELSHEPGFRIRYRVTGRPVPLYPSCEIVLYRNAQEAITNAIRHGKADELDVELCYADTSLSLTVSNNGALPQSLNQRGLGLSGMEERTRLLGGELAFEMDGRFAVTTRIPLIRS
jgi:two-component system, NarL family, sensor kinase